MFNVRRSCDGETLSSQHVRNTNSVSSIRQSRTEWFTENLVWKCSKDWPRNRSVSSQSEEIK